MKVLKLIYALIVVLLYVITVVVYMMIKKSEVNHGKGRKLFSALGFFLQGQRNSMAGR